MPALDPNALHVVNGDHAADTFRQAITGSTRALVSRDVLSCGPLRAFANPEEWKDARMDFWRPVLAGDPRIDLRVPQHGIWENLPRLANAPRIYLWAGAGNTDQLMVALMLELLERTGADPSRVELVEFLEAPATGRRVMQMGELDAAQMRQHPAPRALTVDEWQTWRQAWRAVTDATPDKVCDFDQQARQASTPLKRAVRLLLRRYPASDSGLDFWDRQLIANVQEHGPRADLLVGHTMGERFDEGDLTSDRYLFWRLRTLASLPRPLVTLTGDTRTLPGTQVALTEFGAQVSVGEASSWPDNPIDYWAGGVHVSSAAGELWFTSDRRLSRG